MLRADVEGHALGLELDVHPGVGRLGGDVLELLAIGDGGHDSPPSAGSCGVGWSSSGSGMGSTSTMPGHGFTRRATSGKSLRSGFPSNSAGQVDVAKAGVADERRRRTSPSLTLVPVGPGVDRGPRGHGQGAVGDVGLEGDRPSWLPGSLMLATRANTWKRVSPPVTPCWMPPRRTPGTRRRPRPAARLGASTVSTSVSMERPKGDGIQSITDRKPKYLRADRVADDLGRVAPGLVGHPDPQVAAGIDVGVRRRRRRGPR